MPERHAVALNTVTKISSDKAQSRKQRPLGDMKQAHVNSLFFSVPDTSTNTKGEDFQRRKIADNVRNVASPWRPANFTAEQNSQSAITNVLNHDDDNASTDLSAFVVPDSASDGEIVASRSPKKKTRKSPAQNKNFTVDLQESGSRLPGRPPSNTRQPTATATSDIFSLGEKKGSRTCLESPPSEKHSISELVEAHPNSDDRFT